jgi:hypothetical protein
MKDKDMMLASLKAAIEMQELQTTLQRLRTEMMKDKVNELIFTQKFLEMTENINPDESNSNTEDKESKA